MTSSQKKIVIVLFSILILLGIGFFVRQTRVPKNENQGLPEAKMVEPTPFDKLTEEAKKRILQSVNAPVSTSSTPTPTEKKVADSITTPTPKGAGAKTETLSPEVLEAMKSVSVP